MGRTLFLVKSNPTSVEMFSSASVQAVQDPSLSLLSHFFIEFHSRIFVWMHLNENDPAI